MKKFLFILFGLFVVAGAFAAGENIPTSKSYVDSKLGEKQDIIPKNDGATQVLTNTGTAGEYGTKGIYDANGEYATQQNNLVDAATMNAGVQNAINSEFQCIEWLYPNDHSSDCLLMDVLGQPGRHTINLLDESFMDWDTYGPNTVYGYTLNNSRILPTENGKTYTLSAKLISTGSYYYYISEVFPDGTHGLPPGGAYLWNCRGELTNCSLTQNKKFTFTTRDNAVYLVYMAGGGSAAEAYKRQLTISEYQMEEGATATPYQPHNLYLPVGN